MNDDCAKEKKLEGGRNVGLLLCDEWIVGQVSTFSHPHLVRKLTESNIPRQTRYFINNSRTIYLLSSICSSLIQYLQSWFLRTKKGVHLKIKFIHLISKVEEHITFVGDSPSALWSNELFFLVVQSRVSQKIQCSIETFSSKLLFTFGKVVFREKAGWPRFLFLFFAHFPFQSFSLSSYILWSWARQESDQAKEHFPPKKNRSKFSPNDLKWISS